MSELQCWNAIGASVAGTKHERIGKPCQDAHEILVLPQCTILGIADGAGSASESEFGAKLALNIAMGLLGAADWSNQIAERIDVLNAAFSGAYCALKTHSTDSCKEISEFATTLSVAVLFSDAIVVGQVGDGRIVALTSTGEVEELAAPTRGEYANQTDFLTSNEFSHSLNLGHFSGEFQGVAMHTDGILTIASDGEQPFKPFYKTVFDFVRSSESSAEQNPIQNLLQSEKIRSRCDDDLTLVIAERIPSQ